MLPFGLSEGVVTRQMALSMENSILNKKSENVTEMSLNNILDHLIICINEEEKRRQLNGKIIEVQSKDYTVLVIVPNTTAVKALVEEFKEKITCKSFTFATLEKEMCDYLTNSTEAGPRFILITDFMIGRVISTGYQFNEIVCLNIPVKCTIGLLGPIEVLATKKDLEVMPNPFLMKVIKKYNIRFDEGVLIGPEWLHLTKTIDLVKHLNEDSLQSLIKLVRDLEPGAVHHEDNEIKINFYRLNFQTLLSVCRFMHCLEIPEL